VTPDLPRNARRPTQREGGFGRLTNNDRAGSNVLSVRDGICGGLAAAIGCRRESRLSGSTILYWPAYIADGQILVMPIDEVVGFKLNVIPRLDDRLIIQPYKFSNSYRIIFFRREMVDLSSR
jgi:hypothetical protein